ncbi:MAG: hypothetical protein ONB06_03185 [candidate division KSB1 bacterium]|nr:hypothetical protein [candidate division KSB1 bacterium]
MARIRVQFIHGLEGSPRGTKARLFAQHFDACTPAMDTRNFQGCVALQERVLREFRPDVLIGSSFGGAVAVALLHRRAWAGPTLLLAPAVFHYDVPRYLPEGVPVWIVHGTEDAVVSIQDSRTLALTGTPSLVRLIEVKDDHALSATTARSDLVATVRALAAEHGNTNAA